METTTGTAQDDGVKGWLLGSGGGIPTPGRATCSALVRSGDRALLIDAGTGVAHLLHHHELLDSVAQLDVVLTHFHLDHTVGLAFLPSLPLPERAIIHGPGEALYGTSTEALLRRLLAPPFLSPGWDLPKITARMEELHEGEQQIGPFLVAARTQTTHPAPTFALRIGDFLTYCTDTAYEEGNARFAEGSRVLCHEAWSTSEKAHQGHSSAADAASVALDAGVDALLIIHVNPQGEDEAVLEEARRTFRNAHIGKDLMELGI